MTSNEDDDYRVGYGKPPRHSQFQKGASGNPAGKAKRPDDLPSALVKVLREQISISENGQSRKLPKLHAIIIRLMNRAASGDVDAIKLVSRYRMRAGSPGMERKSPKVEFEWIDEHGRISDRRFHTFD